MKRKLTDTDADGNCVECGIEGSHETIVMPVYGKSVVCCKIKPSGASTHKERVNEHGPGCWSKFCDTCGRVSPSLSGRSEAAEFILQHREPLPAEAEQ